MAEFILLAVKRALVTLASGLAVIGGLAVAVLFGPEAELRIAPVVNEWRIIDPRRTGDQLQWSVLVDKRRSCPPETRWLARWGNETASLKVAGPSGEMFRDGIGVLAGERAVVGPFTAPIPRGWQEADAIRIAAVVTYSCGLPWRSMPFTAEATVP